MGWNDDLNKINSSLMDFFFPRKCPFCGKTTGKQLLCDTCRDTLPRCERVRYGADFGRCAASLYYEGAVRQAILDFKFKGKLGAMDCFGRMMAETAAEVYSGEFDAVTWGAGQQKAAAEAGVRSGPVPDRQHVRGLARDAAGDAAQGAGQPAPVRHRRSGGASGQRAGTPTRRYRRSSSPESVCCWWTISAPPAPHWASAPVS